MKAGPLTLSAISVLALAAAGCSSSPEEHASTVAPTTAQATGPAVAVAAEPKVEETTTYTPAYVVDRDQMRGVLLASNPAVYSNTQLMSRPDLYHDPAAYQAWVASVKASQTMAGGTAPPATRSAERENRVYFDWNQATLTPDGRRVVDAIAKAANADPASQIALVGKADLSGTDAYNMGLSQRRADTVRNQLVAEGVAASRIETRWVGDTEPPVPTARGVREARNRVVDMTTTMMVGSSAPQPPVILPRRVLFTSTEESPPGANGQELPGVQPNGSVSGPVGD